MARRLYIEEVIDKMHLCMEHKDDALSDETIPERCPSNKKRKPDTSLQ